jgi:alkylation response protein AidB-like acyl-CoA dehydrogenase
MELSLSPEQRDFQAEVRAFLRTPEVREELARVWEAPRREEIHPERVYRWLGERGWLAVNWPKPFGGLGKTMVEASIVGEEMIFNGVPDTVHVNTVDIIGFFLLLVATPAQKQRLLLPIARGELNISVLYSEPGVGSDLASLQTRAERDGDGFRLYGTKVFSLRTQFSTYGLCAARTNFQADRYRGLSLLLVRLDAPGVTVRPLWNVTDERFNEVVLDGARVEPEDVIGPVDGGWQLISAALALERTGLDYYAKARRWLDALTARAAATGQLADPRFAHRFVELDARVEAARLLAWRVVTALSRGEIDEPLAAGSKWYASELARPITELALDMEGLEGTLSRWDGEAPMDGLLEAARRETPALTFSGGTSEIMLHVVSTAGLKLHEGE